MKLLARWRRSLSLRVIAGSSLLILVIVIASSTLLINQVRTGVIESKVSDSLVDAVVGLDLAIDVVESFGPDVGSTPTVVDAVVATLARRSGEPAAYEVLMLSNGGDPERSSNLVLPSSVPADLIFRVFAENTQHWTYTEIDYLDGSSVPAIAVGAPMSIAEQQQYGLFLLYPTAQQQQVVNVVQSALWLISVLLAASLIVVVVILTRRITDPIRTAADTAQKIAAGLLDERLTVSGEDEVARWAESFNLMTESLEKQIKRLEDLSIVQQRFVSDVSHELRTPVTTVRLAADLLHSKRNEFPPEISRAAELLQGELDRFEMMLADLLEISRIDAGASLLQISETSVFDLVHRVIDSILPVANAAGIKIEFVEEASNLVISVDSRRIERAIRNLITNAIKHSGTDRIRIEVESELDVCIISVIDYGVGLSSEHKSQVFQRFWRADPSRSRDFGGTGLGLSIALEDIKQHSGEINVKDNDDKPGTQFVITVPVSQKAVLR
ncbi:MAG: HAMP domain-containing histidine kinase [Actinobacteria bacterium]|nr:HAMP domain-containing histidine kinase [Actinomycetota bacterium]